MIEKTVKWEKYKYYYIRVVNGFRTYGDLLSNDLEKIVHDGDISDWAIESYRRCARLLQDKKRWPNEFNTEQQMSNRWIWNAYKIIGKIFGIEKDWGALRPQNSMTRDAYYSLGYCLFHFLKHRPDMPVELKAELAEIFMSVYLPWYLYRPFYWRWRRKLIKDTRKHFIKRIDYVIKQASAWAYEVKYEDDFYNDKP